jgi:hypothetical protein
MAVPSNTKPKMQPIEKMPPTPTARAKARLRNQYIVIAILILIILSGLALGFIEYILPYAKPVSDDGILNAARFMKQKEVGAALKVSLKDAEDTSGSRADASLGNVAIGRLDPFDNLRPDPPPPEPEWPSIRYAGLIKASSKQYAIVEIEGSTYSARPGDVLLGEIVVTKINESNLTLSFKGFQKEFALGGESK